MGNARVSLPTADCTVTTMLVAPIAERLSDSGWRAPHWFGTSSIRQPQMRSGAVRAWKGGVSSAARAVRAAASKAGTFSST